ncbi:unnamed protein product [Paramecium octaurelia]|uniref:Uncharacterized protein n=1 Tax=Paramecium octaurelia TaxID=43137 RepID=A0A8S1X9L2_PAROT|nr:unnamed protein product [Paramecium octaurelia]
MTFIDIRQFEWKREMRILILLQQRHQNIGVMFQKLTLNGQVFGVCLEFINIINSMVQFHIELVSHQTQDFHMVVIKTTNSIINSKFYGLIVPILSWLGKGFQKLMQSQRYAINGLKHFQIITQKNLISIYSQPQSSQHDVPSEKVFILISDTVPIFFIAQDDCNYWKNDKIPYTTDIQDKDGYTEFFKKVSIKYSHEQDAPKFKSLDDMKRFTSYMIIKLMKSRQRSWKCHLKQIIFIQSDEQCHFGLIHEFKD